MRVVLDTNVWVSGILFRGEVRKVIEAAVANRYEVLVSPQLLAELERVLHYPKFGIEPEAISEVLDAVRNLARIIHPRRTMAIIRRDPSDNRLLECARAGRAAFIVTGDRHLLELETHANTRIITPKVFLGEIGIT